MTWIFIFVALWPIAFAMLFAFAARIEPRTGRWLGGHAARRATGGVCFARYCLQRITIDRFFTLAPKIPPTVPPDVAPLSTSFETTS